MSQPVTKLSQIKTAFDAGQPIRALRIAARFPSLGDHKERITRTWAAHTNPETYTAMGYDPGNCVADGIAAIKERFAIPD